MAYEKQTWVNGDVITAEKLNHMEDGIAEGGEAGYAYSVEETFLFNETFESGREQGAPHSQAQLNYSDPITADVLKVEFDGVEYICPLERVQGSVYTYGESTFEKYPFMIVSNQSVHQNWVYMPTTAEHSIEVSSFDESVSTTRGFEKAVNAAYDGVEIVDIVQTGTDSTTGNPTFNVSFEKCQQIASDFAQGKTLVRLIVREYGLEAPLNVTAMRISTDSYVGTTCYISGNAIDDLNAGSSGLRVCFAKAEIRASGGTALTTRTKTIS